MALDLEAIRRAFVQQMEQWLELLPEEVRTEPFVSIAGIEDVSPVKMVAQVRNRTEWGERLLENAIALSASRQMQQVIATGVAPRPVEAVQSGRISQRSTLATEHGSAIAAHPASKKGGDF